MLSVMFRGAVEDIADAEQELFAPCSAFPAMSGCSS
jgi:hypothetical protein